MNIHPVPRAAGAASLVLAPLFGLAAALVTPGLHTTRGAEITAIREHTSAFQAYAVLVLLSSYLLVPAFVALMAIIRTRSASWAYLAGGIAQVGMLVAVGDAATDLMYSQMGAASADPSQMSALADRYESATSPIYGVGGLCVLVGTALVAVALWRTRMCPRWAAASLAVSMFLNIAGFVAADKPVLVSSYVVMLAALGRIALVVLEPRSRREVRAEPVPA